MTDIPVKSLSLKGVQKDTPLQGNLATDTVNVRETTELAIALFHSDSLFHCQEGLQILWTCRWMY